ncbi:MAG: hypothetical protein SNJ29_09040 [Rikenellaceae bacterium]
MDRIQDVRAFEEAVFDALNDYIKDADMYPSDAVLQINTQSYEVSIESTATCNGIDNISLSELISAEGDEIDCDTVNELANRYSL